MVYLLIFIRAVKIHFGVVTPIYKSGSKSDITNYRPITIINSIAKIYEDVLYGKIYEFVR